MSRERSQWLTVPKSSRSGCAIGALALIVGMLWMAGSGILLAFEIQEAVRSNQWPIAHGVTTFVLPGSGKHNNRSIAYTFEVSSGRYSGNRHKCVSISLAPHAPELNQILRTFAIGAPVSVAYDPQDPTRNVLSPGAHWTDFVQVGALLFLPTVAVGLVCFNVVGVALEKAAKRRPFPS